MTLVVARNYGSRDEISRAARRLAQKVEAGDITADDVGEATLSAELDTSGIPDPDLMVRTSGEHRLSNFLLWQLAYTEFVFLDVFWPDFSEADFDHAIDVFGTRDRRFGSVCSKTKIVV